MALKRGSGGRVRRHRSRLMVVEPLEGRALLATSTMAPAPAPPVQVAAKPTPPAPSGADAVVKGGQYAAADAWDGYWLVHSKNVARVGLNYAKLTVSHNTRKVGAAYFKAILKGDGPRIEQLNHTDAARRVSHDFSRLSTSPGVRYVGNQFAHFGRSIADQYHKLFGGGGHSKPHRVG